MNLSNFILTLCVILFSTKLLGIVAKKFNMPQVVGSLLAGLILGPSVLGIIKEIHIIKELAEIGVILLMFTAGLETDLTELKKCGKASFIIALAGVALPLIGGFLVAGIFNNSANFITGNVFKVLENVFIGVILTATSVSITVETLQEMGKLKTPSGMAILGSAIIDDILGIIILAIVTEISNPSINIYIVLLKIIGFFIISIIVSFIFTGIFNKLWNSNKKSKRIAIFALTFCLIMSFLSENYFGVADITGAYIAGVIISKTDACHYVEKKINIISYMFLSPIFLQI